MSEAIRIAMVHPDLGIGGAERLVVDAAAGLQKLGHSVKIYTSHHDPKHCFDETKDGRLNVRYIQPPSFLPRSFHGKFHIVFAHLRQLHLTLHMIRNTDCDVFFVDQLSTCIPFLRLFTRKRVVFYCHFPDKLLADGEYVEETAGNSTIKSTRKKWSLKGVYRIPMDWWEEQTTNWTDLLLANSNFTASVTKRHFPSISLPIQVIYPGIDIASYQTPSSKDMDSKVASDRPTFLSLNRFENKKNLALAISAFAEMQHSLTESDRNTRKLHTARLVLAGGYDPRLQDNISTLKALVDLTRSLLLTYHLSSTLEHESVKALLETSISIHDADVIFILKFTNAQRNTLLHSPSTVALLYTPSNEHFGIGPVEAMACGLPILACNSGGPKETVIASPSDIRTGWLESPSTTSWSGAMKEIARLSTKERSSLSKRAKSRVNENFTLEIMAKRLEAVLVEAVKMGPISFWEFLDFEVQTVLFIVIGAMIGGCLWLEVVDWYVAGFMVMSIVARRLMPGSERAPSSL